MQYLSNQPTNPAHVRAPGKTLDTKARESTSGWRYSMCTDCHTWVLGTQHI